MNSSPELSEKTKKLYAEFETLLEDCTNPLLFVHVAQKYYISNRDKRIKELEEENKALIGGGSILLSREKPLVKIKCPDCKGEGKVNAGDPEEPDLIECPVCNGKCKINKAFKC